MQCNHEIDLSRKLIAVDIAQFKMQAVIAVFTCRLIAFFDHIRLEIEAHHLHLALFYNSQIIIQNKGQVGFPAAEIDHAQRTLPGEIVRYIVHHLKKTVNLLVFIIHCVDNFSLFCEYTQVNEGLNHHAFFKQIALFPVVRLHGPWGLVGDRLARAKHSPLCADSNLVFTRGIPAVILAEVLLQCVAKEALRLILRQLFMKHLLLRIFF